MSKFDKMKKQTQSIVAEAKHEASHFQEIADEYKRVENVTSNAAVILKDLDKQFESATKLNGTDITFLFFATALQCVRQYFLTPFRDRMSDKEAANATKGHQKESSNRVHRYYNPSLDEIITNPVPFDAIYGGKTFDLGLSGNSHRAKTLGHDPILGWIFGTANIATSTMTTWDFQSFHVKTGADALNRARDQIVNHADTLKVLSSAFIDKALYEGIEGKEKIGASLVKEAIHLKSDISSTKSLPIPIVSSMLSPDVALKLAEYGLDAANVIDVGKQASFAIMINFLVSMIHSLFYDESRDGSRTLYEVKTRKILSYSNLIATASNIIAVAVTEAIAVSTGNTELAKKGLKYLDIGGLLVTCHRLISDHKFIKQVKLEFLEKEWYNAVYGEEYKFMTEEQ